MNHLEIAQGDQLLEDAIKQAVKGDADCEETLAEIFNDERGSYFERGHWVSGSSIARAIVEAYELGRTRS